jgi:glycosyltransferase involved in cell wall biosynthesis
MKILLAHSFYQHPGGEDQVVSAEAELLRSSGHEVVTFHRRNIEVSSYGSLQTATLAARTVWAWDSYTDLRALLQRERPDVAHFHNILPLISPSAFYACKSEGVPVVQTLHNYRLICPSATLFRNGHLCEECVDSASFAPAIAHACYRDSRSATVAVASMITVHKAMGTWSREVDCYIALSVFARDKLLKAGLPAENVVIKPNFLQSDPGAGNGRRDYALFIGRLVAEKGIERLLNAWAKLPDPPPLRIAGDGPLRGVVEQAVRRSHGRIEWLGQVPRERTLELIKRAQFLVFPSEWYEGFPLTLVESLACGTPVIAARIGSVAEIIVDGSTGIQFTAGDVNDLAAKINWASSHPNELAEMGMSARREFLSKYTAKQNYSTLMEIYERARTNTLRRSRSLATRPGVLTKPNRLDRKPAVMLVHNFYQHRGGEDNVAESELRLLTRAGHRTITFFRHNQEIGENSWWAKGKLGMRAVWSTDSAREMRSALLLEKPDLVHFHNFVPLLSPALYYACKDLNIPVIQTLHNYRLLCPAATLYRDGKVCEECLGKLAPWPAVVHKCYRQDSLASAAVGVMITAHEMLGTWKNMVDRYIALTEFARRKLAENGVPGHKIVVKPNYLDPDPGAKHGPGEYALFVGRLSPEKGIRTLLESWRRLMSPVPLVILGEGPCRSEVTAACEASPSIQWLGRMAKEVVIEAMKRARFLVLPSECYESFPLALVEAFACALPLVASALGAVGELVDDGRTGLTFRASDPDDLAAKVSWAWAHPREMEQMGSEARREFEAKYTAAANYEALTSIYNQVLGQQSTPTADHGLSSPDAVGTNRGPGSARLG